jgi:hypothetical protein
MTMAHEALWDTLVQLLKNDIGGEDQFPARTPFLAHYTSLDALENILKNNEIGFSNPLFMNDLDEVIFGFKHGAARIKNNHVVREALKTEERHKIFSETLDYYISNFDAKHLLDTYVFCLSEHDPCNTDGMLSMWRGYGGNGRGAALVFDLSKLDPVKESPINIVRVNYGSDEERFGWLDDTASIFAKFLAEQHVPDDKLYFASNMIFHRIKVFSLMSKHHGFREEKEWRFIYMSDGDDSEKFKCMRHYLNGPRGVEPKLKFRLEPMAGVTPPDFSLDQILASILLGPSASSALAVRSVERMLELIERPELKRKLSASSIPLRET